MNEDKSSITLLNEQERRNPEIPHPFINATEGIVYLGIKITPSLKTLNTANYEPVLSKVKDDTATWTRLPLSIIGRINIIKINMLPKFLYIFQSIPLAPPSNFFSQTKNIPSNCIWSKRNPRLRLSLLYLPCERGGLQVPNFQLYCWEAQLRAAMFWFPSMGGPVWQQIEYPHLLWGYFIG